MKSKMAARGKFKSDNLFRLWWDKSLLTLHSCFPSCNHWNLGDRNNSSGSQTSSAPRKGAILFRVVASCCHTHDHVLHYCRCPVDRGLRIHSLGFRFVGRACSSAAGFHVTRPIPPPTAIQQFLLLCSGPDILWSFARSTSELHSGSTSFIAREYGQRYYEVFRAFCPQRLCVCPRHEEAIFTVRTDLSTSHKE